MLPFYVSNDTIHSDLKLNPVDDVAKILYKRFHNHLTSNINPLINNLVVPYIPRNPPRLDLTPKEKMVS